MSFTSPKHTSTRFQSDYSSHLRDEDGSEHETSTPAKFKRLKVDTEHGTERPPHYDPSQMGRNDVFTRTASSLEAEDEGDNDAATSDWPGWATVESEPVG